ncbi:MAG: 50S ribosomal protein L6 [Candidatus Binatia bacterium]
MSRLGRRPIPIPDGVKVDLGEAEIRVEGPKGKLNMSSIEGITVRFEENRLVLDRSDDSRGQRSSHGLARRLLANLVEGVSVGFSKTLEINGVGYRADVKGNQLHLSLGFSHPVVYQLPEGIAAEVDQQNAVTISGIDRQVVGQVAAEIRRLRPPEPYKGKGIRYRGEHVRRKAGKAAAK